MNYNQLKSLVINRLKFKLSKEKKFNKNQIQ